MPRLSRNQLPPLNISLDTVGKRIAKLRKKLGLTQKELAEKIGIPRSMIADYECNRHRIYDEMIIRIAIALQVSTDELLGLKVNNKKDNNTPSLRLAKRINKISKLPEYEQKFILKTIDSLLKAAENKNKE